MQEGDPALLGPEAFRQGQCVFDLIYHHPETPLMGSARAAGAVAANGLNMLLHQGARAFALWTERDPPVEVMRTVLRQRVYAS